VPPAAEGRDQGTGDDPLVLGQEDAAACHAYTGS
jgi:hypothetical protein